MDEWDGDAMSIAPRLRRNESGATAVLVAASMVLLMGMAALVVDYGLGLSERRLDQNVADSAVMGGAIVTIQTADMANGVAEVKRLVDANLDRAITNAEWQACVDADQLTFLPEAGNDCISWDTNTGSVTFRVRVPKQDTETTFGKILGVNTLSTDAFAEATLENLPGGKLLPFSLFAGTGTGTEQCLKDTSGPPTVLPPPCDDASLGQFGGFDPYVYSSTASDYCKTSLGTFIYSLAVGIDHPMSSFDPDYAAGGGVSATNAVAEEGDGCPGGPPKPVPNTVGPLTGNKVGGIGEALLVGGTRNDTTFVGRLRANGSGATVDVNGPGGPVPINNQPIWSFFSGGFCSGPLAGATTPDQKKNASLTCLQGWTSGTIFNAGFINSQRLAFVPMYDENDPSVASTNYHINRFVPVYLESTYVQSGGTFPLHSPGATTPFAISGSKMKALTAIVLNCAMLVDQPCDPETTSGDPFAVDLSTLLLSR